MRALADADLVLDPQVAAHADEMFAVLADPAIYEHENEPPPSVDWLRERFRRLESRRSPDGGEQWLNWVVRLDGRAIGYLQASVRGDGSAAIAYVFGSAWWGRGLASRSVRLMVAELEEAYGVRKLTAVLKASNARSAKLLAGLGFAPATPEASLEMGVEPDEILRVR